jgi:hypothetical protein
LTACGGNWAEVCWAERCCLPGGSCEGERPEAADPSVPGGGPSTGEFRLVAKRHFDVLAQAAIPSWCPQVSEWRNLRRPTAPTSTGAGGPSPRGGVAGRSDLRPAMAERTSEFNMRSRQQFTSASLNFWKIPRNLWAPARQPRFARRPQGELHAPGKKGGGSFNACRAQVIAPRR